MFLPGSVLFFPGKDRTDFFFTVPGSQLLIHTGYILPARGFELDGFSAPGYLTAHFREQLQQFLKACRFLFQRMVNHYPQLLPMGRLCLISQPFVIAFSMRFRILDYGQTIFYADCVA